MKECSGDRGKRNAISYPKQLILQPDKAVISCAWKMQLSSRGTEVLFSRRLEFKQLYRGVAQSTRGSFEI